MLGSGDQLNILSMCSLQLLAGLPSPTYVDVFVEGGHTYLYIYVDERFDSKLPDCYEVRKCEVREKSTSCENLEVPYGGQVTVRLAEKERKRASSEQLASSAQVCSNWRKSLDFFLRFCAEKVD